MIWIDLGPVERFTRRSLSRAKIGTTKLVVSYANGEFGVLSGVCISTTSMDGAHPRYSASDALLGIAIGHGRSLGAETQTIHLAQLEFRSCEGYYSKSSHACSWPCSITQMDPKDQMHAVYEAF